MSYTYNYTAANSPTPVAPSTFQIGPGTEGAGSPLGPIVDGTTGWTPLIDQLFAAFCFATQVGPGGYGTAYNAGLDLVAGSGLTVTVTTGQCFVGYPLELVGAGSAFLAPYSLRVPPPKTLTPSTLNYIWLSASGALIATLSTSQPFGGILFLGTVVTGASTVTSIDYSNRYYIQGGRVVRRTADIGGPTDTPPVGMNLYTTTTNGIWQWNGVGHGFINPGIQYQSMSVDLALSANSNPTQYVTPTADGKYVILPPLASMPPGWVWNIVNNAAPATHNVGVKKNAADGSGVLVNTTGGANPMTPGTGQSIPLIGQNGTNSYPASPPYIPGAPVAGVPGSSM